MANSGSASMSFGVGPKDKLEISKSKAGTISLHNYPNDGSILLALHLEMSPEQFRQLARTINNYFPKNVDLESAVAAIPERVA